MINDNRKFYLVFSFAFFSGILVDYFFYGKPIGVSFFIFVSIFLIFSLFLVKKSNRKLKREQVLISIFLLLFSAGVFLRASPFLKFFNSLGSLYLLFLFVGLFSERRLLDFPFLKYSVLPFSLIGRAFKKAASFIKEFLDLISTKRKFGSAKFQGIVRGIIISFPVLIIFLWLFSLADVVFQKYLDSLLKISIDPEIVLRSLIVLVFSYFFVGFFIQIFANQKEGNLPSENKKFNFLGTIESSVVLGTVGLLFLIFIIIQFVYLFGGKEYVWGIEEYITYSEYARKGFGELIAVSIISLFLIWGIDKFSKKENIFQKRTFKILSSALVLELFVIMFSAAKRLSLYIDGYGFTFSRLFGLTLLLWLFFVLLIFLFKIIYDKKETVFLFSTFLLTIIFLIGLNIFNPDAFIARKNIERHIQGKHLDVWYFNRLSDDAIPEIIKIFSRDNVDDNIKMDMAINLYDRRQGIKERRGWQSFNLSHNKTARVVERNYEKIKKYQVKFWEREEAGCEENFRKCEERCEGEFPEKPEEIIKCEKTACGFKKSCEIFKENIGQGL